MFEFIISATILGILIGFCAYFVRDDLKDIFEDFKD